MPTDHDQNAVSSTASIISSIENDRHVYHWFLMLISLPDIQQKLSIQIKAKKDYRTLKRIQSAEIITYLALGLMMLVPISIKQPWYLLGGILPLIILAILFRKNGRCVAAISEQFLLENTRTDELTRQTLYQTCEYLSRIYNIPSLVDLITNQDFISRKVLLGSILFIPFIYPFKTWQSVIVIFIIFAATVAIINTLLVLKKLK